MESITKKYAQFSGRAGRQEFWLFALLFCIVYIVALIIDTTEGFFYILSIPMGPIGFPLVIPILTTILSSALALPYLAVVSRRLHDTNRSAWWMLIAFIPLIGAIWLLVLFCFPGTDRENRFGIDPRTDGEDRFVTIIVKFYNHVLHWMAAGAGLVIFSSFAMIVIDVSIRIAGLKPPLFTMAVVEYGLLWFTMLAAPWLVRIKGHVFIDAVTQFFPPKVKKVVAKIVYSICIVSSTIYCIHTFELFQNAWVRELLDLRSVEMPEWLIYLPMPVCFFLVAIEFTRFLIGIDDMYDKNIEEREGV